MDRHSGHRAGTLFPALSFEQLRCVRCTAVLLLQIRYFCLLIRCYAVVIVSSEQQVPAVRYESCPAAKLFFHAVTVINA